MFILLLFLVNKNKKNNNTSEFLINEVMFEDLPGWNTANIMKAKKSLERSCHIISKGDPNKIINISNIFFKLYSYEKFCKKLKTVVGSASLKKLLISSFYPVYLESSSQQTHFTGYIELELNGRLYPNTIDAPNAVPIFKRPKNLLTIDLGLFKKELKGNKITGLLIDNKLLPAPSREEIESKKLYEDSIIAYIEDPARAFFLHIQGSGIIKLPNGEAISVGYDGNNGKEYFSIGQKLIKEQIIDKESLSMQTIIKWMHNNKELAASLRNENERYIFFKERKNLEGPIGSSGTIITPMHSAAVDNNFLPYHLPLWVAVENFNNSNKDAQSHFNLYVSQDTGSAIKGPTRIDLFLGRGEEAENIAGKLSSKGKLWALIPK